MLLYGLINPIGVIPIYSHLLGKADSVNARRIIIAASPVVAGLLIASGIAGGLLALFIVFVPGALRRRVALHRRNSQQ